MFLFAFLFLAMQYSKIIFIRANIPHKKLCGKHNNYIGKIDVEKLLKNNLADGDLLEVKPPR